MHINVKGTRYKILYKKLDEKHGLCDREKKIIYIDTSKDTQDNLHRITFLHELTHAYITEMYISDVIPIELEEILCEMVAHMIHKHADLILGLEDGSD